MDQIIQCFVECNGCGCSEITPCRIHSPHFEDDAGEKKLGYKRASITKSNSHYCPLLCPRCQNNLDRLDLLRLAIRYSVESAYGPITHYKLLKEFVEFERSDYTDVEVTIESWKLIEKEIIQVDNKGILTVVKKD